jgi:hypothetical protein
MKTILIPTDFTSASLQTIEETIRFFRPDPVNIILFHAFEMPGSLQDIVGPGSRPHMQVMSERFRRGCKRIKDKYGPVVYNIVFRPLYGNTVRVFRNYLEFNKVDVIIYPSNQMVQPVHERSVSPDQMIKKCGYTVISSMAVEKAANVASLIDAQGNLVLNGLAAAPINQ